MGNKTRLLDPKDQIKSLLQDNQSLSRSNLDTIERSFSKSEIETLINLYPNAYQLFVAHAETITSSWHNKILAVLKKTALARFKEDSTYAQIPNCLLFEIVLPLAWSLKWYTWYSKKRFCSPDNRLTSLALLRIKQDLNTPGKARAVALARLENFPIELIKEALLNTGGFNLKKIEVKHLKINAVWAEYTTPNYQEILNAKNVDRFTQEINNADVETIEKLMRQLIFRRNTSFFRSKYEAMLEACFIRVMKLTPPQEAMKLDSQVVIESLCIFDGYFFSHSRKRFFEKPGQDGYNMLASFRRTVPRFNAFPKLRALLPSYTLAEISEFDAARLAKEIKSGNLDIQKILVDAARDEKFNYEKLVECLVSQHGANLEWMDTNYTHYYNSTLPLWANSDFSQLNFPLLALNNRKAHKQLKHWDFYVKCKKSDFNAVLVGIIDSYIHCLVTPNFSLRGTPKYLRTLREPIAEILSNPTVVVTKEMLAKFDILEQVECRYGKGEEIKTMLVAKFDAQIPRAAAGEKGKDERVVAVNNNNNNDESLERLKYVLEHEHYFVDINPLVQAVGERIHELDEMHWGELYLHELTPETRQILPEDENAKKNMCLGYAARSDYLKRLRGEQNGEDVSELIRNAGSAVKALTPGEVQRLRSFPLDKDVQIFLSEHFNANLTETVIAHESSHPVYNSGMATASVGNQEQNETFKLG